MQQSVLHRLIGRHAQCQATMGTYQTAGTLDELAPQRTESEKVPQGRAFLQGQAGGGMAIICSSRTKLWANSTLNR